MKYQYQLSCYRHFNNVIATGSFCLLFFLFKLNPAAAQPPGFTNTVVSNNWNEVNGLAYDSIGNMYVWEKGGKVWIVDTNGVKLPQPLIDISEEVGNWRDHGLNGFALDPHFLTNGYIYLDYTVDRHYLINYGTGAYNPTTNNYFSATIERVTRYTADAATNFTTVIPASRHILIGETKKTGIPVLHESHSGATLLFGADGTLLVSTGDGASYNFADGGGGGTYWSQALTDSIITAKENVGAFRSQMLTSLNGKVLRIDPETGDGIESNPYYDAANPHSAKSRVWALGFRNPFRMCLRPGTGSADPTAGDPGVIYMGDVGWDTWEDINVIKTPGGNYGWPLYEGLTPQPSYQALNTTNQEAPNPLFGTAGCTQQYFRFKDLLQQATMDPAAIFTNPCNTAQQIPASIPVFFHTRPVIDFKHATQARTGIYNGFDAAVIDVGVVNSPVQGATFGGYASVGGCWYTDNRFPLEYQNTYFHGDYAVGFIRQFMFDADNNPTQTLGFWDGVGANVFMAVNPRTGCLMYVNYPAEIRTICYSGSVNNLPVAVAEADTIYGTSPLTVNFTGSNSTDPENGPLTYSWDFGDGNSAAIADPSHVFTAPAGIPTTYVIVLTVTDNGGLTSSDTLRIFINNTPPNVQIISFSDGDLFSLSHNTILPLEATVTDAEHGPSELFYDWKVFLHHNSHEHPEAADTNRITSTVISPVGCDGNVYYYRVELTVTDAGGLSTTVMASIYPACDVPVAAFTATADSVCPGSQISFSDLSTNLPDSVWWYFPGGDPSFAFGANPTVTYNSSGTFDVTLIAGSVRGIDTLLLADYVTVFPQPVVTLQGDTSLCGGPYVLDAGNAGVQYLWNDASTNQSLTADSSGTYFVTITDVNGCQAADTTELVIFTLPVVTLTLPAGDSLCINAGPVTLTGGLPVNGIYTGTGVAGSEFNPFIAGQGIHTIVYTYTDDNGCSAGDSADMTVLPLPVVTLAAFAEDTVCINHSLITLSGGLPVNGTYSGSGVTAGVFDPTGAGAGIHTIIYTYTDGTGCSASDSSDMTVLSLPVVTLDAFAEDTICINHNLIPLSGGLPLNGTYSGNGVTAGVFDPAAAGAGIHTIIYSFTDANGCADSAFQNLYVDLCVGLNELEPGSYLSVSPNPAKDRVSISFHSPFVNDIELSVTDVTGKEIIAESFNYTNEIHYQLDMTNFALGIYLLQLNSGKQFFSRKVVKL